MEDDGWRRFLGICREAKSEKDLGALLGVLLTPTERQEIAVRVLILRELLRGELTQREIAEKLPVSIAKVTRGSNVLKQTNSALKKVLAK